MYSYDWDPETGGLLLKTSIGHFSKEPRPVYYREMDLLGFDQYWNYDKDDSAPYMWAEAGNYYYRGRRIAQVKGGTIYEKPHLILLEKPNPRDNQLIQMDLERMILKNQELLDGLVQSTVKDVYNTYRRMRNKIDVAYVAFSGGKDSVVALDIVQRSLPHNDFVVIFGDTDMEFPTTYHLVENIQKRCTDLKVHFFEAKADIPSEESWRKFGPPARRLRWCCSVHKSVPVINFLRKKYNLTRIRALMITGVRGHESVMRSGYEKLSRGKKLAGQWSFHPLLEWSSAEVYLYIFANHLDMNEAYKLGFNRVGCIMCPDSSEKHEYIKRSYFKNLVDKYVDIIADTSGKDLSGPNKRHFLEIGGWKNRLSGRELKISEEERVEYTKDKDWHIFSVIGLKPEWSIWYKTIGDMVKEDDYHYQLEYKGVWRKAHLKLENGKEKFYIENLGNNRNTIEFISFFKTILIKTQYCIQCMTCVAECPYGNISMMRGKLEISDRCIRCHSCLKVKRGCLFYNSVKGSKDMKTLKGINRYLSVGVDAEWIKNYFGDSSFEPGNRKTDVMYGFMTDAGVLKKRKLTPFGEFVKSHWDNQQMNMWALMLCNLVYTPAFGWFVRNIPFDEDYSEERLEVDMGEDTTKKAKGEFWNGFKTILGTNTAFQEFGIGIPEIKSSTLKSGEIRKKMLSIRRRAWENPDPRVILYALFKYAEACGGAYSLTLTDLVSKTIDSEGISPVEIFGINKERFEKVLNGLTVNYPDFINASFTLGLDTITLKDDKSASDVLELF